MRWLVLTGYMGAGKSAVGRRLAARLGVPLVDADREIEARAGMAIPEIFSRRGELWFRRTEEAVVRDILAGEPGILALGGGALESARTRGLVTEVGKVLDPLADKLMVVSVLLSLVVLGQAPFWAVGLILGREVAVSVLRSRASKRGGVEVGARPLGKAKMALQVTLVLVLLAAPDPSAAGVLALLYATVAVTVVSGLDIALHMRRGGRPAWSIAAS